VYTAKPRLEAPRSWEGPYGENDLELVKKCGKASRGFIAMKGLPGGLIADSAAAFAFLAQFDM